MNTHCTQNIIDYDVVDLVVRTRGCDQVYTSNQLNKHTKNEQLYTGYIGCVAPAAAPHQLSRRDQVAPHAAHQAQGGLLDLRPRHAAKLREGKLRVCDCV